MLRYQNFIIITNEKAKQKYLSPWKHAIAEFETSGKKFFHVPTNLESSNTVQGLKYQIDVNKAYCICREKVRSTLLLVDSVNAALVTSVLYVYAAAIFIRFLSARRGVKLKPGCI